MLFTLKGVDVKPFHLYNTALDEETQIAFQFWLGFNTGIPGPGIFPGITLIPGKSIPGK